MREREKKRLDLKHGDDEKESETETTHQEERILLWVFVMAVVHY